MLELKKFGEATAKYLRLDTRPVAVKLIKKEDQVEGLAERPSQVLGERVRPCVAWHLARHQGFPVLMLRDDFSPECPPSIFIYGLLEPTDAWLGGDLTYDIYTDNREAAGNMERQVHCLPVGEYQGLLLAPLDQCRFDPDLVMVFCNSLQATQLVASSAWKTGEPLHFSMAARCLCSDGVVQPYLMDRPVLALPCGGDRLHGRSQDYEVVFTTPVQYLGTLVAGLEGWARSHHPAAMGQDSMLLQEYKRMASDLLKKL